nr:MAG TPA: hypothetical protein [Caudoviricetes sp.]
MQLHQEPRAARALARSGKIKCIKRMQIYALQCRMLSF